LRPFLALTTPKVKKFHEKFIHTLLGRILANSYCQHWAGYVSGYAPACCRNGFSNLAQFSAPRINHIRRAIAGFPDCSLCQEMTQSEEYQNLEQEKPHAEQRAGYHRGFMDGCIE
jgi:hypothetical protein